VVLSSDAEGNSFGPLESILKDNCVYAKDDGYDGEIGYKQLTSTLKKAGITEDEIFPGQDCIVLYPEN
jgi:hypothetical protein